LTINGVASVTTPNFRIVVDNALNANRFFTSLTLVSVDAWDRHVGFSCTPPYGDWPQLYGTGAPGVAVTATFTNGGAVLTFTMPVVYFPERSPSIPGRQEIMLPLEGTAFSIQGGNDELSISLNPGP
jgi:hypothetical protein